MTTKSMLRCLLTLKPGYRLSKFAVEIMLSVRAFDTYPLYPTVCIIYHTFWRSPVCVNFFVCGLCDSQFVDAFAWSPSQTVGEGTCCTGTPRRPASQEPFARCRYLSISARTHASKHAGRPYQTRTRPRYTPQPMAGEIFSFAVKHSTTQQ